MIHAVGQYVHRRPLSYAVWLDCHLGLLTAGKFWHESRALVRSPSGWRGVAHLHGEQGSSIAHPTDPSGPWRICFKIRDREWQSKRGEVRRELLRLSKSGSAIAGCLGRGRITDTSSLPTTVSPARRPFCGLPLSFRFLGLGSYAVGSRSLRVLLGQQCLCNI